MQLAGNSKLRLEAVQFSGISYPARSFFVNVGMEMKILDDNPQPVSREIGPKARLEFRAGC